MAAGFARPAVALVIASLLIGAGATAPVFVLADQPVSPSPTPAADAISTPTTAAAPTASPTNIPAPIATPTTSPVPADQPPSNPLDLERVDLRSANSQTFAQPDGSFVTEFYSEPIFWQPPGHADWQPIDTKLRAASDNGISARADHAPAQLDLAAADNGSGFAVLHGGGHVIRFRLPDDTLPGRAASQPATNDNGRFADYADFLPGGISLRVFPRQDGFASFLVLPSRPASNIFAFEIEAPGLTLVATDDGGAEFRDSRASVVGRIPRPYMLDSSVLEGRGGGLYSDAVKMTLTETKGPAYLLTLNVDPAFLDSAVYPVYVDPTTTDFPTGSTTADDTFASQRWPNTVLNTYQRPDSPYYHEMWHGNEPGTSYYNEVYLRFNGIASTLGDVEIDSAALDFYPYWQYYHSDPRKSYLRRITSDWSASTLKWNLRPSVAAADDFEFFTTQGQWSGTDVTDYVQDIVAGAWTDHGVMIHNNPGGQGMWKRIVSRDDSSNYKPHLTVVWHSLNGGRRGDESYYTRVPFDLGGGWRLSVGVHNGELTLDRDLFEIPSYGPAQSMSLSYSSLNTETAYMGVGWSSNLTQHLTFDTGLVYWHRADNGLVAFTNIGGVWTPPPGHFDTLSLAGGEYTVTLKDQTKYIFESTGAGRLKRITNRFGKSLTLVWNTNSATATDASGRVMNIVISGGLITSVTDSAGRQWQFGYTSGKLTSLTDPAGNLTTLVYSADLLTGVDRTHYVGGGLGLPINWDIAYAGGKVSEVIDAAHTLSGRANTFAYNGSQTTVGLLKTDSPLTYNSWTYNLDSLGRATSSLDPGGYTTSYVYDTSSNLTQLTLPITKSPLPVTNQVISYTYDARGNVLTQTTQLTATANVVTAMSYNATNDLLTRSEANNDAALKLVTRYTYDGGGHLTSVNENCTTSGTTPPADASTCTGAGTQDSVTNLITSYTYTANHQVDTEIDPRGIVTKHTYDTYGNETQSIANYVSGQSSTNERNVTTTYAYDQQTPAGKAGLATSTTDPVGNVTTYTYDALGRQLSEVEPGDASVPALTRSTTYDEFGNALTETDAWTGVSRTTTYAYDMLNRQTRVTDPAGVRADSSYDAAGNPVSTTSGGVTATKVFDGLGQPTELSVGSSTSTAGYDGRGMTTATADPAGVQVTSAYDLGGRLLSETVDPGVGHFNLTTTHAYDLLARETSSTTPEGITTTTAYDRAGRVVSSSVAGATTAYTYDRAGNQVSSTDPDGTVTTTTYDALNRATTIIANDVAAPTLPIEDVTSTTYYDAAGRVVAVRDDAGITTRSIFNPRGAVSQTIANCTDQGTTPTADPANCTGAGTHDATTNVVSTSTFDGSGAATSATSAQGSGAAEATFAYAYDAAGRTQAVMDAPGTVTRTIYDSSGRVSSTIVNCTESTSYPAAPPTGNWWECNGSTINDGTWNVTSSRTYDAHGNVATETAPNGRLTTYVYDAAERLTQRIDNDVPTVTLPDQDLSTYYAYDAAGRQSAIRKPTVDRATFAVTRYIYNAAGQLASEIRNCTISGTTPPADPAWKTCSGAGTRDADTNLVTEYGYDSRGNRSSVTAADPSATSGSSTATVITRHVFDDQNRLCRVLENANVDPATLADPCTTAVTGSTILNVSTRYAYDDLGNMTSMVDARGNTTVYGYDALGRLTTITDADGNTTTYAYNNLGQRISQSRRGTGQQSTLVSWTYDAAGRIATRTAGGVTTSYTYDDNGNRTSASTSGSTISTTFDRLNRPLTVTISGDSAATTSYTYSLTSPGWTDPSGAYSATLDKFDRQVALTDPIHGASQFTWTFRADGQLASHSAPNGNTTTSGYDDAGTLATKTTAAGGTNRAVYAWTRNRAGQILSEASTITNDPANGTTSYTYDPLSRLVSSGGPGLSTAYGWQAVPNRELATVNGNSTSYTFDSANRETTSSAGNIDYDTEGRLTARPGQILVWDDLGRLIQVKNSATQAVIAAYAYDAIDRLLTVTPQSGSAYRFRYVGLTTQVAQTVDVSSGAVLRSYANDWTGERLVDWTGTGSDQHFYGTNLHRDVAWTASDTGAVTSTLRYDPWGNLTTSYGNYLPAFRFQGSWFDPTVELSWVVARWYAPGLGRFISEDTLLGRPAEPASRHLYSYASADPLTRWDPQGNRPESGIPSQGYWVKARAGENAVRLASLYLGSPKRWPVIVNRNRWVFKDDRLTIPASQCVYIEPNFAAVPRRDNPCPPTSFRSVVTGTLGNDKWMTDGTKDLRLRYPDLPSSWLMLTSDVMEDITDSLVRREHSPGMLESMGYRGNRSNGESIAEAFFIGGWPWGCNGRPFGTDIDTRQQFIVGSCIPKLPGNALTLGNYVFLREEHLPTRDVVAHEYIHTLQWETDPASFVKYFWDVVVQSGSAGPHNEAESLPYLWQAWMVAYGRWVPKPWAIWLPL
jgi:RHS repeat-associated protein